MRARLISLALFAVVAGAAIVSSCGYDPNPASGTLQCGPQNSCPENYSCMSGHCYRNGGGGSTGTAGHGGGGGTGGSSAADKFIGADQCPAAREDAASTCEKPCVLAWWSRGGSNP